MAPRLSALWPPTVTVALIVGIWYGVVAVLQLPAFILPTPDEVLASMRDHRELLWSNALVTTIECSVAFALSLVAGVAVGVVVAKWRLFALTAYPLLLASQSVPKLAVAPIFSLWLGFGFTPKILTGVLIAFFPVVISTVVGFESVDRQARDLARSMGMGRLRTMMSIELPSALPAIFAGSRVAITFAVIGAVIGEFVGADAGLGRLTVVASTTLNTPLLFAALAGLTVMGLAGYALVVVFERIAIPWHQPTDEQRLVASM